MRVENDNGALTIEQLFGGAVRRLRRKRGWTQEVLAEQLSFAGCPMHQTTVAKMESGSRPTTITELAALAQVFRVPIHSLLPATGGEVSATQVKVAELAMQVNALTASVAALEEELVMARRRERALVNEFDRTTAALGAAKKRLSAAEIELANAVEASAGEQTDIFGNRGLLAEPAPVDEVEI